MPAKNNTLHGQVPDKAPVALLLIDIINDFEFEGSDQLIEHALPMARQVAKLKRACKHHDIPVIYVNDNFGRWQSDMQKLVEHSRQEGVRGKPIVDLLVPDDDDYFVLKPKQSGFFSTTLDTLLEYLHVNALILTGVAGNICVQFTAQDAYMRDLHLYIPRDCIASNSAELNDMALKQMEIVLKADTTPSEELDLEAIVRRARDDTGS